MRAVDFPLVFSMFSFAVLSLATWTGIRLRQRRLAGAIHEDFNNLLAATLTLLALLIGFTFSMAVSRYDQRTNLEAEEANVIGTEYLRSDLLGTPADVARTHSLLLAYLDQRILFYTTRDAKRLERIALKTAELQKNLWLSVRGPAGSQPNPLSALALAGMNEVIDSEGYAQAAWVNRIPRPAWILMEVIAIFSNAFMGYGILAAKPPRLMVFVLPLVVSISFFLIADIDSPRGGVVSILPHNLASLSASLVAETRPRAISADQTP